MTLKKRKTAFKSGRVSLRYFEYVNHFFGSISSQEHRKSTNNVPDVVYSVLMLRVRQMGFWQVTAVPRVIRAQSMFDCSRVSAHRLERRFGQTGISIDARDRRDVRKQRKYKTVNLQSRIDVSIPAIKIMRVTCKHLLI